MTPKLQARLDEAVGALRRELAGNLYSCAVYGSAVRGNAVEGVSDLNLLVVLNESQAEAHDGVARALAGMPEVEPFVLGKRGFERSVRAFAAKFASIRRNYKVAFGADPLATVTIDPKEERFLAEQAVRNFRLRLVYAYVKRARTRGYGSFAMANVTTMFVAFSEVLRLSGITVPQGFRERIPVLEREFKVDGKVLADLLSLRESRGSIAERDAQGWHERIFPVADAVLRWIEEHWTV